METNLLLPLLKEQEFFPSSWKTLLTGNFFGLFTTRVTALIY